MHELVILVLNLKFITGWAIHDLVILVLYVKFITRKLCSDQ
jgi:hypothetical protein